MAQKKLNVTLIGDAPILIHNGHLTDPLNPIVKEMKKITDKKRGKTDEDLKKLADLEFRGGLYLDKKGKILEMPEHVLEGAIKSGAKKANKGPICEQGVYVSSPGKFSYKGPRSLDALCKSPEFRLTIRAVVKRQGIMRTRPKFDSWSVDATYTYDDEVVNKSDVVNWLEKCGKLVGIGDWRPKYGRFHVKVR